jgi:hypothetical protein
MNEQQALEHMPGVLKYLRTSTEEGKLVWDGDGNKFTSGPWALALTAELNVTITFDGGLLVVGNGPLCDFFDEISVQVALQTLDKVMEHLGRVVR